MSQKEKMKILKKITTKKIDSRKKDFPDNATKDEILKDQHRPMSKKEEMDSRKILEEYKLQNKKR